MQQTQSHKRLLSFFLCMVLIAALALFTTACNDTKDESSSSQTTTTTASQNDAKTLSFIFTVVDVQGKETSMTVTTDKTKVGEALLEKGLIAGEESTYGLYVKTVNGVTLDYNKDGKYWAFYVNGNYAAAGVDTTPIVNGATYTFKAE